MARKKKYPKQPKQSSSKAVWERYLIRVKEVARYNKELADKPKAIARIKEQATKAKV